MIGYCPSAGRIQPRHLLSFSTDSTAIAQVANTLSHNTRIVSLPLSRALPIAFFPPSLSLILSRTFSPFSSRPCATIHSSRAVRFGIDAAADIGGRKKKIGRHDCVGNCVHAGASDGHGLTDLLRRPRTDASARRVSFLRFSPARPLPTTLSNRNPRPSS